MAECGEPSTAAECGEPSTAAECGEPSTAAECGEPSTAAECGEPSTAAECGEPSTAAECGEPSTAAECGEPSTAAECGEPSTAAECGEPSTAAECGEPSTAAECGEPSTAAECGEPSTAAECGEPSTAAECGEPSTVAECGETSTAAECGEPSTAAECGETSTAAECGEPSTAAECGEPSTAAECGEPITAAECGEPGTAAECGEPSTAAECGEPSTAAECGEPSTAAECGEPSTAAECGEPSTAAECGGPSTAAECGEPSTAAECGEPSTAAECGEPSTAAECGEPSTAAECGEPSTAAECGEPSTAAECGEPSTAAECGEPSTAAECGEPSTAAECGEPSTAAECGEPSTAAECGEPSTAAECGEPGTAAECGEPGTAAECGEPGTAAECGEPSTAAECGEPSTAAECGEPSTAAECGEPSTVAECGEPSTVAECGEPSTAAECVFDGPSSQSFSLGKYCGTSLQGRILKSTQNQMTLHFKSDYSIAHAGFQLLWTSNVPACGGLLSGQSTGTISSPQFPMNFPPEASCVWVITVTPGRSIAFTLGQIDLSCSNAFIDIYDGENEAAPLHQRICGSNTPSRVVTTGPSAFICFYSNYATPHQGFSLTYRETGQSCGRDLTGRSGTFNSPAVSADGTRLCVWTITVPENNFIELRFSIFRQPCQNSMLTVHDGNSFTAPILGRLCGDTAPAMLNTTSNTMHIEWRTDSTAAEDIFIAQWNGVCGRKYVGETGVIDISTTYSETCYYSIEVPVTKTIFVSVTHVTSELNEDCGFLPLVVYDGNSVSADIIRQVQCSETLPQYLRSSSNQMLMVLYAANQDYDYYNEHAGYNLQFTANFSAQDNTAVCGGVLNGAHGSLRSPHFPDVYHNEANCTWYITVDEGHVIKLMFHTFELFELEGHGCRYDFVDVYDGATTSEQRMGRYCGSVRPPELISTGNAMVVHMVTDTIYQHIGFYASYVALNQTLICGRTLTAPSGIITSPNYPNNYPANKICEWTITVGNGKQILLNISDFEMEISDTCLWDHLEIRNGGFKTSPILTKLCGYRSHIEPIKSHSNRLYLKFVSDFSFVAKGFYLEYSEVASGCGGELMAHTGSIESPNYPENYPPNILCQWRIHVAAGSKIILTFDDHFDISCLHDYIEIEEGRSHSRRFCGLQAPRPNIFQTNELLIKFRSEFYLSGIGFSANYHSECNNVLNGTQGVIESPNFPNPYPPSQQCSWAIQVPQGNKISAHFAFFSLEDSTDCRLDYVQITRSNLTGSRLCGNQVLPNFMSNNNELNIGFQSNLYDSYPGFRLEWIIFGCGDSFRANSGSFNSLNYPQQYSNNIICLWEITVDEGHVVKLFIEDLDLEYHRNCSYDALEVRT
ncbi:hypothetical protein Btru_026013 [Bulinus truncatus]|nr:hypothetical protein Btru_026013 [Bulinus truncatus]